MTTLYVMPPRSVQAHLLQPAVRQSVGLLGRKSNPTNRARAFTLIEMLGVVLVIALLVGVVLGVANYASNRAKILQTKALLATLELACENYKADQGYYPRSTIYRLSFVPWMIDTNSWLLYRALTTPKQYMSFSPEMLAVEKDIGLTTIVDAWKRPIVYYCPGSNVPYQTVNIGAGAQHYGQFMDYYMIGGQVNGVTFDLFSFGPDMKTHLPGIWGSGGDNWKIWTNSVTALDDIWVGRR